ncbi:LysR substrate-binding domain-containing protein [Sulfitobacter aestuarii]|uniref:LysR substrate-binding domain-containing protein n=1 Tax=Sulfitobacter aestuarii TaxID=2161676 RepID=A0ABW5U260_9RHOB
MALRFTFRQLEYLVAVGDAGTIAQAAHQLNVSSPSISTAIAQLETQLGIQLFVRHHAQGLSLTPGGRRVFNEAKRIMGDAAALSTISEDVATRPGGPLAVGALSTIAPLLSARFRRSFEKSYPMADVTLFSGNQVALFQKLARAEIDVAITYDMEIAQDIHFEGLVSLPPWVMLHPEHPMARQDDVSLREIAGEPLVLLDLPLSREYFLSTFRSLGVTPTIADRAHDLSEVRSLVANGFGYSLLNIGTDIAFAPDGQPLAIRPIREAVAPVTLGLATKQVAAQSAILRAFFEHVGAEVTAHGLPATRTAGCVVSAGAEPLRQTPS